ncbi:hypothetical protein RHS04_06223 [Rhizoctonia solani]|uniref:Uncharacterized protein n=1 Tax=Rhizoctonia solani TaxID=456999 RepID=A0A8H7LIG6_9AGAM|nr:hypothetical protein RHS04_06223 [Rhizoctonia solani]
MGNHSDKSLDKAHRHWGRPLASYYDSIRETRTSFLAQRKNLGLGAAMTLRTKARSGIQKICELGERRGPVPPGYINVITLSVLESISKLVLLPRAVGDFAHPTLISGCIKLMASIQESGRVTPFAYEYGYLCFRIFKIAVDVCILNRSRLFTSATSNMVSEPLADPIMLLSRHTDQAIQIQMNLEKENRTDNPHGHRIEPPLDIAELPALLTILYEDRKAFSIAMMPSHSLGLAGTLFLLGKSLSNESSTTHNIMEMYCEVLWRYSNTSVWDKVATQLLTSHYREQAKSNWKPTFVDLEDSVTILRAANIAISPDDNRIPGPFDISAIPVLVGFAAPFVELGSEAFVPQFLDVTIGCMWNSLTSGKQSADSFIDSVRDIFYHISKILTSITLLFPFPDPIHKQVIKTSFRHDLFELTARLILMISPRSGNLYFLGDAHNFFSKFGKLVPKEDLEDTFGDYFPEWVKFADYFFSCLSVPGISKEDREFFTAVVRCWNAIGVAVGPFNTCALNVEKKRTVDPGVSLRASYHI